MTKKITKQIISEARSILLELAISGSTMNYREFAERLKITQPPVIQSVSSILEYITQEDVKSNFPILSSLIIQKGAAQIPRKGFFIHLQELGVYQGGLDNQEAVVWHQQELKKLKIFYEKQ